MSNTTSRKSKPARSDDTREEVCNWINEDIVTEWRSAREWQLLYYLDIDTAKRPYYLRWALRFSYELDVEYENLFEFCWWLRNNFPEAPMPEQIYKLEFSYIYDPLKDAGILGNGKVNNTNIWKVLAACAKLDQHVKPGDYSRHISWIICGCYGIDAPWSWHLQRLVRNTPRDNFLDADYCQQFAEWYATSINKIEKDVFAETGVPLTGIQSRTEDRRVIQ